MRVNLTLTNPDRPEPPPLISAASKKALGIMTDQLDTLSRSFDMLNAANPLAAGVKAANWGASNAVSALSARRSVSATRCSKRCCPFEDHLAVAALSRAIPSRIMLGLISTTYALTGLVTGALALDPPDGNFTTVFQPTNHSVSIVGETAVDSALIADSTGYLDDTLSMLIRFRAVFRARRWPAIPPARRTCKPTPITWPRRRLSPTRRRWPQT